MNYDYSNNAFIEIKKSENEDVKVLMKKSEIVHISDMVLANGDKRTKFRLSNSGEFFFDGSVDEVLERSKTRFI